MAHVIFEMHGGYAGFIREGCSIRFALWTTMCFLKI